jgi:hypothetical protein
VGVGVEIAWERQSATVSGAPTNRALDEVARPSF